MIQNIRSIEEGDKSEEKGRRIDEETSGKDGGEGGALTSFLVNATEQMKQFEEEHKTLKKTISSMVDTFQRLVSRPTSQTVTGGKGDKDNAIETKSASAHPIPIPNYASGGRSKYETEYKNAFCRYIRYGAESSLMDLERKSAFTSNLKKEDIGYAVTTTMHEEIERMLLEVSPMRRISNVTQISNDALELIGKREDIAAGWSDDGLQEVEKSNPMQFAKQIIPLNELYAQPKATQKYIDDPRINIEDWLSNALVETFHTKENDAFVNGDGRGKPKGILSYSDEIESLSASGNEVTVDDIIKLFYSLPDKYSKNGKFLMHRSVAEEIRKLRDNTGRYLWQQTLDASGGERLLGLEVIVTGDMPFLKDGGRIIALGDFKKAYQIIDREGIRILRDPFTNKPFVKFYANKRVGGGLIDAAAIKFLQLGSSKAKGVSS